MEQRSITLPAREIAADGLGYFRWGNVAGQVIVTTDAGDWAFLSDAEFDALLAGRVGEGHARFAELQQKGLLREGLDLEAFSARMGRRNRHIRRGPHLHVVNLTGSGSDPDRQMTAETATRIIDFALKGTSPAVTFDVQGRDGEPLRNFATLQHLVETAQARNKRDTGKTLRIHLISNLSAMTDEIAEWLIAHDVLVTTWLDGPAEVHDANREWLGGTAHADVVRWIDSLDRRYAELGRDTRVGTVLNVTRQTIAAWPQVLEEHVQRKLRSLRLQALDPSRFAPDAWAAIGYTPAEYLDFYRRALADILRVNSGGTELSEVLAAIIAGKILSEDDPGIVDIQSPCGAGTNQISYDAAGRVFPSDEARRVDADGDPLFELGQVEQLALADVVRHPTVRAIAAASLLDTQPMCADCWNKPFCGFSPVRSYIASGDLFGRRTTCFECKEHLAVSRQLFEILTDAQDSSAADTIKRWAAARLPQATDGRAKIEAS